MRDLILGTAGHIDHGKTSLIRALTGIDCDRLPEEKTRGMTIDIGFAHLELGGHRLGIVDVPGHERFIRNMLAGATGVDLALLVVAADDAVMPQTREHLEILRLLDLRHGLIALTKCDLVDETMLQLAEDDVRTLVAGSFLASAPIVRVSARTGEGVDALRAALAEVCAQVAPRDGGGDADLFRMAVDRSFVVQGRGTIVTGTVASGTCRVGDEVQWLPRDATIRVRGAQSHGRDVDAAHRGMRAALNLAGVKHDEIVRGHELAAPGFLTLSRTLTVDLRVLADAPQPLKHRTPVRVHLAAAEVMGVVSLLEASRLAPGESCLAQLMLAEPVAAVWGQPVVLREASANWTYGGGRIVQPVARPIRRRKPEILASLAALAEDDLDRRLLTAVHLASLSGVELASLPSAVGASAETVEQTAARLLAAGHLDEVPLARGRRVLLHCDRIARALRRTVQLIRDAHDATPWQRQLDRGQIETKIAAAAPPEVARMLVDRLLASGEVVGDARRVALCGYEVRLTPAQQQLKASLAAAYADAGIQRRLHLSELEKQAAPHAAFVAPMIQSLVEEGQLVHIEEDLFLAADAERQLREAAVAKLKPGQGYRLGEIREQFGSVRQLALPLCGYLERLGLLRREGDLRFLAAAASEQPLPSAAAAAAAIAPSAGALK